MHRASARETSGYGPKLKPRSVALLVWRGGERLFVPVSLS